MQPLVHPALYDVVSALVHSLGEPHAESGFHPPFNDVTEFILGQLSRMPDCLRLPMRVAVRGFDSMGCLSGGVWFHSQSPERRRRQIQTWKQSRLGVQRDLIRYFESLAVLSLYSRAERRATDRPVEGQALTPETNELRAEVVVIGSGPGGSMTACLLAEAGRDVLLVEEGPHYPLSSCEPFSLDEMVQKYRNGGQTVALGQSKIAYVEGRCVGGGSEINSGLYHRTPPQVLEHWRKKFKVDGLSESEMAQHFEICEREISVSPLPGPAPAASLKLHDGATRLDWKSVEVPRWFRYEPAAGASGKGTRQSMTETYVPRFLRAGGRLLPRTRANQLRQDGNGWIIAARHESRGQLRLSAETIFLCAGAVQTPALLRRSGISQNIGNSLQVHPTIKIAAQFPDVVNTPGMGVPVHQVKEFAPRLSFGCSISSPPYLALSLIDHPPTAKSVARDWQNYAIYYAMITSEGRGSVRVMPGFRDPVVRYSLTQNDRRNLADGLRKLAEMLFAAGARALYPSVAGGPELKGADALSNIPEHVPPGRTNLMTIHLFSSCPMGEDQNQCATDSFGRVHGFRNLFVNDASLLCTAPGVNPQGSVMALARRNVLDFLKAAPA